MARPQDDRQHSAGLEQGSAPEVAEKAPANSPMQQLARDVGNHGLSNTIARSGGGLLPGGGVHSDVSDKINSMRGGGQSLDASVAGDLSGKYGSDVSGVRVHTDDTADALARSVSARAFATGQDVFFAKGNYDPGSSAGRDLINHEVAHTVQMKGAPTGGPMSVTNPGDAMETHADQMAAGA